MFVPGDHVEADETVIRWYDVGGAYVGVGLPMYLALERKPDNGCEIQNLANVASGIMLRLKLVKSTNKEKEAFGQCKLLLWIKRPLPLPPSRHLHCGGHFASKRKAGGNIMLRDGASAVIARSRQPSCAAHAHTKQTDCRSSFGSAITQWWRGASASISTLRRYTGRNRRGGGMAMATMTMATTMHSNYIK
jgi:hypothetical protein